LRNFFWLVLACLLLSAGCARQTQPVGITVDPAFRTLILPATKLLAGVDWDSLKTTDFYRRHQNDLNVSVLNAPAERLGINPLRDVAKVLVSWDGNNWLFLERGRWNPGDLQKRMIAAGAAASNYRGRTLLGSTWTVTFFKTVAVEGSPAAVRNAVDVESAGNGEVPEELQERLRTLPSHDQIWAASRSGLAFASAITNSDVQSALSNITGSVSGATGGIYVDSGVHLSMDLECISDQGATRVHDALRGVIGFARLSTKDDQQDLLRAYDAIQVDKKNRMVEVHADLSGDLGDKLIGTLRSIGRRSR